MMRLPAVLVALALGFWIQQASAHPLDPLSDAEIDTAVAALRDARDVDADTRFALIDLDEPPARIVAEERPHPTFS